MVGAKRKSFRLKLLALLLGTLNIFISSHIKRATIIFFVFFRASWKTEPQTCGGVVRATPQGQLLTSPSYPGNYPGGLECLYIITAQLGRIITLEIQDLDLNPARDYLLIRNGESPDSPVLARLTGAHADAPSLIMSTGSHLYLYFKTSLGDSRRGFKIRYSQGNISIIWLRLAMPGVSKLFSPRCTCPTLLIQAVH